MIGRCFGSEIGVAKSGWFLALASLFMALRLEGLARGEERSKTDKTKQKHGCEEMGEKTVKSTLPSSPSVFLFVLRIFGESVLSRVALREFGYRFMSDLYTSVR